MLINCTKCEEEFDKKLKEFKRSKSGNHFCSRSCAVSFNNMAKPKRKLENTDCRKCGEYIGRKSYKDKRKICNVCRAYRAPRVIYPTRKCPRCNKVKLRNEFYNRRNGIGSSPYCRPCTNDQAIERQRTLKKKCVEYKGGKCEFCNYDNYIGALEFHHKDPSKKDFTFSKRKSHAWSEKIIAELNKCLLLCSNCHREEHNRLRSL